MSAPCPYPGGTPTITGCNVHDVQGNGIEASAGTPSITNNNITNCTGTAISLGSVSPEGVRNNTGSGNGTNGISVGGTYSADRTWSNINTDLPFVIVRSGLGVAQGATLTIEPGVVVKGASCVGMSASLINVVGTLLSRGTSGNPVTFTSIRDDTIGGNTDNSSTQPAPGDWGGLCLKNATQPSQLSYTRITYGGYYYPTMPPDPAVYRPGLSIEAGSHQVSHCQLSKCGSTAGALVISGGSPQIKDDTGVAGPVAINGGSPTVSNCNISVGTLSVSGGDAHHHGLQCTRCPGKWY